MGNQESLISRTFSRTIEIFSKNHLTYRLLHDIEEFNQIEVIGSTIGWRNAGIDSKNIRGEKVFHPFDLDPIVLFENSELESKLF